MPLRSAQLIELESHPRQRLLYCGVGCSVHALRSLGARDNQTPEEVLGLDELYVLGTHCVDNSPTPKQALEFVSTLPSVGAGKAKDVVAYECKRRAALEPITRRHALGFCVRRAETPLPRQSWLTSGCMRGYLHLAAARPRSRTPT